MKGKVNDLRREMSGVYRRWQISKTKLAPALQALLEADALFVHVPKCGGKSVIQDLYGISEHMWFGHAGIQFFEHLLGPRRYLELFKFAFVRDPVLRCRSGFDFRKRGGFGLPSDIEMSRTFEGLSFEKFVLSGILAKQAKRDVVFKSQKSFLVLSDGRIGVDKLCKFEDFSREIFSLPIDLRLTSHKNAAPAHGQSVIPDEVNRAVREFYRDDVEMLDSMHRS